MKHNPHTIKNRFANMLPVIVDVETGGLNPKTDALLEIAAVMVDIDEQGKLHPTRTLSVHVKPFQGAHLDPKALSVNGIIPDHPFRYAMDEAEALRHILEPIKTNIEYHGCQRAILVGHNAGFDLAFMQAAMARCKIKKSPFHRFTTLDTAGLSAVAFGQTVLVRAARAARIRFNVDEAHSAIYDAEKTAELFCAIVNKWHALGGWPLP